MKQAVESSARLVSTLTQDEFIANPPPGYSWNPRLLNEANRHENRTTVGPKFFELEPDGRYHVLLHEVGHDLADEMSADRSMWTLVDNGAFNGIFGGEKRPMGINGQTTPEEMVAEAFATHLDEEAWLREHFPTVHTEIAGRLLTFFSRTASR